MNISAATEVDPSPNDTTPEPPAASPATPSRIPKWLQGSRPQDLLLVGALLGLCVLVKLLWLTHLDIYWDAGAKWHFARQLSYANDFSHATWSHHMARFGVNVPSYLVQHLLGTGARVYYAWPVMSFTLQVLFVYLLARQLSGRAAAVLAALLMIFFTGMTRSASQLLPDGLSGTAAIVAGYAFVRFHEELGPKRQRWLLLVGLACVWAYAIKESSVLMFPGVGLAVLFSRRSLKEALVFSGVIVAYAALETLGFRLFTPYAHRLAIVQEGHGLYQPVTFVQLVANRFTNLDPPWRTLFLVGTPCLVYQAFFGDKRGRLLTLFPIGFVFFLTFLVRSIDPLLQWTAFKPRYMAPTAPFFAVAIGVFVASMVSKLWRRFALPGWRSWPQLATARAGVLTLLLCTMLGLYVFQQERASLKKHPLVELKRDADIVNDAYRRNLPIVQKAKLPRGADAIYGPRGLNTIYAVYLDDAEVVRASAKPGWLPDITDAVQLPKRGKKYSYIARDPKLYRAADELEKMIEDGCALVVTTKRSRVGLGSKRVLPAKCKAPTGEAIPH